MARDTFVVNRTELRQILISFGVSERNISSFINSLEKTHRHTNIIVFESMREKMGVDRENMSNLFRRMGMDDVTISNAFRMVDENKIMAEMGRVYEAEVELS
jgi:copper homeostasis protein CutC